MSRRPVRTSAFTLVEILIVVVILGILAMLVVPKFSSATQDARASSCASLVQTLRSQIELYKLQHGGQWPTTDGTADATRWDWTLLTGSSTYGTNPDGTPRTFGPYLQERPRNPFNGLSDVATFPSTGTGFVLDATGAFYAVDGAGAPFPPD